MRILIFTDRPLDLECGNRKVIIRKHTNMLEMDADLSSLDVLEGLEYKEARIIGDREPSFAFAPYSSKNVEILSREERYWEAHEVVEDMWRSLNHPSGLQKLILLLASQIHCQMGDCAHAEDLFIRYKDFLEQVGVEPVASTFTYPITILSSHVDLLSLIG
ncbi:TVG1497634 [Thermoplasma volcanium GSS1]|uniref:TVG1497634 protein n=1 Tax=Thermoplasma volcanium (strain ATCC 51530 / DSM 4299 / JCM 9571 / NBRC 15438 / GSS1) TaxID=273116 RepID=Q978G7_THEVO|nr:DUF309 domain-containing protein [Thermoplasma volcanium]BAB60590.1 TVG1497634 [Thermoplasma volcanium GSS1]